MYSEVAGFAHYQGALLRFVPDGAADEAFGESGYVAFEAPPSLDEATVIDTRQTAEGIVSFGYADSQNGPLRQYVVANRRHLVDGSLDETFGDGGKVAHPVGGQGSFIFLGDSDRADRIYIGGVRTMGAGGDLATEAVVVRLNAAGALDSSFGVGGVGLYPYGMRFGGRPYAVIPGDDGTLTAPGSLDFEIGENGPQPVAGLSTLRLTTGGTLDRSFGSGGLGIALSEGPNLTGGAAAQMANGDVIVVGEIARSPADRDLFVARQVGVRSAVRTASSSAALSCEIAPAKSVTKLRVCTTKCHMLSARKAFAGTPFDATACHDRCRVKFDLAQAAAIVKDGCPSCLVAAQSTLGDRQVTDSSSLSNALFCDGQ